MPECKVFRAPSHSAALASAAAIGEVITPTTLSALAWLETTRTMQRTGQPLALSALVAMAEERLGHQIEDGPYELFKALSTGRKSAMRQTRARRAARKAERRQRIAHREAA
jgi:hypothetical protein